MENILFSPEANVFYYAMVTAIATGVGAIPFFFFKNLSHKWLGISNAVASGLMLAASFGLIFQGLSYNLWFTVIGILIGLIFIFVSHRFIDKFDDNFALKNIDKADSSKILLIVAIMTLHSFTEGVSVGVSFSGSLHLGIYITTAIAIHNIPEGLAISLVLIPRGTSTWKAMWWSIFSSLPQPIMAVPAFLFVELFKQYLPMGLGFAGGAMIWMVFAELLPDALEDSEASVVATTVTISTTLMILFQALIN